MITIITVVKNDYEGFISTYNSLTGQINADYEWIIVDGKSEDNTKVLIEDLFTNNKAKGISEKDHGIYDAMNKGIDMATGEYIIFMNAGDIFLDENVLQRIDTSINAAYRDQLRKTVFCGDYYIKFEDGTKILRKTRSSEYIWYGLPTSHQATIFPTDFLKSNKYDLKYKICGDYYIVAMAHKSGIAFQELGYPTAVFSLGGISSKRSLKLLKESLNVQKEVLNIPLHLLAFSAVKKAVNTFGLRLLNQFKTKL